MKVLLDECLPRRLKNDLPGHAVFTVPEMGWSGTQDGPLLRLAEQVDFEAFMTVDASLAFQQNLRSSVLRFVLLRAPNNRLETLQPLMPKVIAALPLILPGTLVPITLGIRRLSSRMLARIGTIHLAGWMQSPMRSLVAAQIPQ